MASRRDGASTPAAAAQSVGADTAVPPVDVDRPARARTRRRGAGGASDSTRERLLRTAAVMFRHSGYDGTTTRELASALSIQSASLYHHIGKKEDLLYELCVDALTNVTSAVRAEMEAADDPLTKVRHVVNAHLRSALADQDKHAAMLIELRALTFERRREIIALRDAYEALIEGVMREGHETGVLRRDITPKHLTLALLNLLNWTIFWYRPDGSLSPAALGNVLATLFLEGSATAAPASDDAARRS